MEAVKTLSRTWQLEELSVLQQLDQIYSVDGSTVALVVQNGKAHVFISLERRCQIGNIYSLVQSRHSPRHHFRDGVQFQISSKVSY